MKRYYFFFFFNLKMTGFADLILSVDYLSVSAAEHFTAAIPQQVHDYNADLALWSSSSVLVLQGSLCSLFPLTLVSINEPLNIDTYCNGQYICKHTRKTHPRFLKPLKHKQIVPFPSHKKKKKDTLLDNYNFFSLGGCFVNIQLLVDSHRDTDTESFLPDLIHHY